MRDEEIEYELMIIRGKLDRIINATPTGEQREDLSSAAIFVGKVQDARKEKAA